MQIQKIKTLGELLRSDYKSKSIKDELRDNLIQKIDGRQECAQDARTPRTNRRDPRQSSPGTEQNLH